jgi:coenzyme F420-reducing hydrogenase delta subunit
MVLHEDERYKFAILFSGCHKLQIQNCKYRKGSLKPESRRQLPIEETLEVIGTMLYTSRKAVGTFQWKTGVSDFFSTRTPVTETI